MPATNESDPDIQTLAEIGDYLQHGRDDVSAEVLRQWVGVLLENLGPNVLEDEMLREIRSQYETGSGGEEREPWRGDVERLWALGGFGRTG